jgi:eukaryotic-like serine/threonine-protein kinase
MTPERLREIEELYHAAREAPSAERATLLGRADPELRREVQSLLARQDDRLILDRSAETAESETVTVVYEGTRLGPYQLKSKIGQGGMGEVFRAVDTRLGRDVAIKIASERYNERFQLEARAISTLNHPHVCTLYDVGPNYLVMELIEGSTLAVELKKGPLNPEMAARFGAQIAGALAEAHSLGILHRDLKPSNIMVTRHGIKVLDFGLAKISPEVKAGSESSVTATGVIMGTPAYMAPEQVEGREPGSFTDLFALGLVVYEMSVGRLPFPGASLGQMLSSGSQAPVPAPSRERAGVPAALDSIVAKLLEKDPAKRPASAPEVARELSAIADRIVAPRPRTPWRSVYAAVAIVVALSMAAWMFLRSREEKPVASGPSSYTQLTSFTDAAVGPALSPDGRMVAFYRSDEPWLTLGDIWVKLLPNGEPTQITHDARVKYNLAFTPDGARVAYTVGDAQWDTYTVSSLGGESQLLFHNAAGLSWLDDSHLLFSQQRTGVHMGVVTSKTDLSDLRDIYFPAQERGMAHYSYLSPDKKWVLLAEMDPQWHPCRVVPFGGGSQGVQVGPTGECTAAAWSRDGTWVYLGVKVSGRHHLWRQRFPSGEPEQVTSGSTEENGIAMAPDGRSLITSIFTRQDAVWIHDSHGDRAISNEGYVDAETHSENFATEFSRDGKRLYYALRRDSPESPAELYLADPLTGKSKMVLPGVSIKEFDISPDEKEAVFSTLTSGHTPEIWSAPLDRSAPPRRIIGDADYPYFGYSHEIFFRHAENNAFYLAAIRQDGTGLRHAFPRPVQDIFNISPDRQVLLIKTDEPTDPSLTHENVFAVQLDGSSSLRICSGHCEPKWSADGRYFYIGIVSSRSANDNPTGQTAMIPIPPGKTLPDFPLQVVEDPGQWAKIPGAKIIEHRGIAFSPGVDPSVYAYIQPSVHGNLYRIPIP